MSVVDSATTPALAGLRRARWPQEAIVRWLRLLAPLLLVVFVVTAFRAHPAPELSGWGLVVSIAVGAFVLGVVGSNATDRRPDGVAYAGFVALLLAGSVLLMAVQPDGPGAEGALWSAFCTARLLPRRAVVPSLVAAFVVLEVVVGIIGRDLGNLAILTALAAFYGMLVLAYRLAEANKQAERLLAELAESQAAQARAAGLAERQRLAREMHDVLAHSLSGLMLQLEGARMLVADDPADPRLPQVIDRAHHLGRTGLDEARRAIGMLRDDELPGPERLAGLAARFQQDLAVPCRFSVSGEARELGSEARLALYRVAQEALTNITRHARPERVELHLAYAPSATRLTVEDFATTDGPASCSTGGVDGGGEGGGGGGGGYGLTGMRERAELLGGTLTTGATRSGFRVELEVPA